MLRQHSEQALVELDKKYGAYCYSIVYNILRSALDTEECLNDILWRCWTGIPRNSPRNLKCYLASLARNQAISHYRKRSSAQKSEAAVLYIAEIKAAQNDPCTSLAVSQCLDSLLSGLSEVDRQLFLRHCCRGEKITELTREYALSETCIRSRLLRLRRRLRDQLEKYDISVS